MRTITMITDISPTAVLVQWTLDLILPCVPDILSLLCPSSCQINLISNIFIITIKCDWIAMKISCKIVLYAPLVEDSKWRKRPYVVLPLQNARKTILRSVHEDTKSAALW